MKIRKMLQKFFDKEIVGLIYRNNNLYYVSLDDKSEEIYEINLNEGICSKVEISLPTLQTYVRIKEDFPKFKWLIYVVTTQKIPPNRWYFYIEKVY